MTSLRPDEQASQLKRAVLTAGVCIGLGLSVLAAVLWVRLKPSDVVAPAATQPAVYPPAPSTGHADQEPVTRAPEESAGANGTAQAAPSTAAPSATPTPLPPALVASLQELHDTITDWSLTANGMSEHQWRRSWDGIRQRLVGAPVRIRGLLVDAKTISFDEGVRRSTVSIFRPVAVSFDAKLAPLEHSRGSAKYSDTDYYCWRESSDRKPCETKPSWQYGGFRLVLVEESERLATELVGVARVTLEGVIQDVGVDTERCHCPETWEHTRGPCTPADENPVCVATKNHIRFSSESWFTTNVFVGRAKVLVQRWTKSG